MNLYDPSLPIGTVRGGHRLVAVAAQLCLRLRRGSAMGADAAVERHDGAPPGEDEVAARIRAEGLSLHGWATALAIPTTGMNMATRGVVLRARPDRVPHGRRRHRARPGRQDGPAAVHRACGDGRRGGRALHRSAPPVRLEPRSTGSAMWRTFPITYCGPNVPHRGMTERSRAACGQLRVSAETPCESVHKALPRKRRRRGGQEDEVSRLYPVRGMTGCSYAL